MLKMLPLFLLVLTSLTVLAVAVQPSTMLPSELLEQMSWFHSVCLRETGTSDDQIAQFNQPEPVEASRELQCYMHCMFRMHNVTRPDGEIDLIDVYHAIPKQFNSIALKVLFNCHKTVAASEDPCERAYSHHKCWKEIEPQHYYLF
ncbi:pheromone-binding protein-related protein 6-like [Anopheles stephensi]|uniref:Uncharacterized protein n=1 Tax=Anopheles stephensi TaxID=30069 RepID=A0A182YKA8_ANOST|nr:pheromone-binding protein-related protein 6-like [Anopheles stephensi]